MIYTMAAGAVHLHCDSDAAAVYDWTALGASAGFAEWNMRRHLAKKSPSFSYRCPKIATLMNSPMLLPRLILSSSTSIYAPYEINRDVGLCLCVYAGERKKI